MPELPEVETVRQELSRALVGARVTHAAAYRADLRAPLPKNLGAALKGRRIERIDRRAKYLLIVFDNKTTLLLHLGMSGRIILSPDDTPLQKHDHFSMAFDNGFHARFNDPRRFGLCDLVKTADLPRHKLLRDIGVEPLTAGFTASRLARLLRDRATPIKTALLNQKLIAGIGNIYASESLFHAGIAPTRRAKDLRPQEISALAAAIRKVLRAAIKAGGSTLRDYVHADGQSGYFQHQFTVYGREGQPCPGCDCAIAKSGGIRRLAQGGRSTFFCPRKQS